MKKFSLLALILVLVFNVHAVQASASFKDVSNDHWAKSEIDYLVNLGVIRGYNDGAFMPNNSVTNAQVALMLVRALNLDTDGRPNPGLSDVYSANHAFKEIATVVDEGIFPEEQKFNPNMPITREAMARALANAFQLQADDSEGDYQTAFWDVPTNYWAYDYINKLQSNHITTGYRDGTFRPKNTLTRAQFAAFIARALDEAFKPIYFYSELSGNHAGTNLVIKNQRAGYFDFEIEDWTNYWIDDAQGGGWSGYDNLIVRGRALIIGDTAEYRQNGCTITFKSDYKHNYASESLEEGVLISRSKGCFQNKAKDFYFEESNDGEFFFIGQ